ncbi:hypothetical protein BpHYR1_043642 [Brachionus plicatilis]|uniref:Uncharacterized protein n=1 Tax=Brachionus plicatilis TaxID=10195 RepID=A0A3M7RLE1_BRAPC|nr:hypothetical protein BpHYR1_043642 [Brachionus plicatilis]
MLENFTFVLDWILKRLLLMKNVKFLLLLFLLPRFDSTVRIFYFKYSGLTVMEILHSLFSKIWHKEVIL